jgi:tRNA dimethylallyltransferase
MFVGGLVEEARALAAAGRAPALRALRAIGYDEALDFLEGTSSLDESVRATSLRTRQLAKRQRTWFRHQLEGSGLAARARWGREEVAEALAAARLTPRP